MKNATISTVDLRALLDVAQGYTTENGFDAVGRHAVPEAVLRAINYATAAVRQSDVEPVEVTS